MTCRWWGALACITALASCGPGNGPSPCEYCISYDIDAEGIPRFIDGRVFDVSLEYFHRISRFRSGAGHSYEDRFEACRSMKHYFDLDHYDPAYREGTPIYAPVDGMITRLWDEGAGRKIEIQVDEWPAFYIEIHHVVLAPGIAEDAHVTRDQVLGAADPSLVGTDVGVGVIMPYDGPNHSYVSGTNNWKLLSWFDVLTDRAFSEYQARGIATREQMIITKEERDAAPLECADPDAFVTREILDPMSPDFGTSAGIQNWVYLQ